MSAKEFRRRCEKGPKLRGILSPLAGLLGPAAVSVTVTPALGVAGLSADEPSADELSEG